MRDGLSETQQGLTKEAKVVDLWISIDNKTSH